MAQSDLLGHLGGEFSAPLSARNESVAECSPRREGRKSGNKVLLRLNGLGGTLLTVLPGIGLYALVTDLLGILDPLLFPGIVAIFTALVDAMPRLLESLVSSMTLLLPGYSLAAVSGIVLGILIAMHSGVNRALKPVIFALSPVPPSMLVPYLIAVLPTFYLSSTAVIFVGCFWPFLTSTINGIVLIDQKYLDNAKVLELKGMKKLLIVILPAASPMILAGAGTALTFSFILLTVAEMFATDSGMGYFIQYYADFSDYARVLAGLLFSTAVFVSIMLVYDRIKKKLLFWTLNDDARS